MSLALSAVTYSAVHCRGIPSYAKPSSFVKIPVLPLGYVGGKRQARTNHTGCRCRQGSYYDILGVSRKADLAAIKRAYRRKAKQCHPDVSKSNNSNSSFVECKRAYEVLSDSETRAIYDRTLFQSRSSLGCSPTVLKAKDDDCYSNAELWSCKASNWQDRMKDNWFSGTDTQTSLEHTDSWVYWDIAIDYATNSCQ